MSVPDASVATPGTQLIKALGLPKCVVSVPDAAGLRVCSGRVGCNSGDSASQGSRAVRLILDFLAGAPVRNTVYVAF